MARTTGKAKGSKKDSATPALAMPGLTVLSSDLVDKAVADLNGLYRAKGLETARAVGEYVLNTFFDGDPDNFRNSGNGHVSFRELGKRADLQVSWLFIWNSVAVVAQLRLIPADIAQALPLSHHKLLLPVKDAGQKVSLATAAVNEGWSKDVLVGKVKDSRSDQGQGKSTAGRPPLPAFAKAFTALRKVANTANGEAISDESFAHFSKDQAKSLLVEFDAHLASLSALADQVRRHVGA